MAKTLIPAGWQNFKYVTSFAPSEDKIPSASYPEFILTGKSNVGKSSLINALTGQKKLARTSQKPGCTILVNRYESPTLKIGCLDLPGWGYMKRSYEVQNQISHYLNTQIRELDSFKVVFWLLDMRRQLEETDYGLINWLLTLQRPIEVVLTKSDQLNQSQTYHARRHFEILKHQYHFNLTEVSIYNSRSIEKIRQRIMEHLTPYQII